MDMDRVMADQAEMKISEEDMRGYRNAKAEARHEEAPAGLKGHTGPCEGFARRS
jgi:hypothetical protein